MLFRIQLISENEEEVLWQDSTSFPDIAKIILSQAQVAKEAQRWVKECNQCFATFQFPDDDDEPRDVAPAEETARCRTYYFICDECSALTRQEAMQEAAVTGN